MQLTLTYITEIIVCLVVGGLIGVAFGKVQDGARRRYEKMEGSGQISNGWMVMPGSMRRVAYLLIALALVQLVCPLLFTSGLQWWVSGGVVLGYAIMLFLQLRERLAHRL